MKKWIMSLMVFLFIIVLFGCRASEIDFDQNPSLNDGDDVILLSDTTPLRKIIYKVDSQFDVQNLTEASQFVKANMRADEWLDREVISRSTISMRARIKTERLDAFMTLLMDEYQVRSYSKEGTDISLRYQDAQQKLMALTLQKERLITLYQEATLTDLIIINQQLSYLEIEMASLQGQLNVFDSLVDYSEVNIIFYGSEIVTQSPFFNRLINAFVNGFHALFGFLDGLMIVLASSIPFLLVFVPLGYGAYRLRKKIKSKKRQ